MFASQAELKQLLVHLRFAFSFFLLPVFLFAVANDLPSWASIVPLFIILHLLVYPSSNGFNSLMDRDTESIGGIEHPQPVPEKMRVLTLFMDLVSLMLTWWFYGLPLVGLVALYIVASRAYSMRSIRLKRFPVIGYLVVVVFQGAWIFMLTHVAIQGSFVREPSTLLGMAASLFMIGASYPLTQVYQHKQDLQDGVKTLSYVLGLRGTFLFAGLMFSGFVASMAAYISLRFDSLMPLVALLVITAPTATYFGQWGLKVWKDSKEANYKNTMKMSKIGSLSMNAYFLFLLIFASIT